MLTGSFASLALAKNGRICHLGEFKSEINQNVIIKSGSLNKTNKRNIHP